LASEFAGLPDLLALVPRSVVELIDRISRGG